MMEESSADDGRPADEARRAKVRYCARCQNHGISEELKGHKRHCPYRSCRCANCEFTQLRQSVMVKVGHLGRHRGDVTRASPAGGKRARDSRGDDDVVTRDGPRPCHDGVNGVVVVGGGNDLVNSHGNVVNSNNNNNNNCSSGDESSSTTPPSDSSSGLIDVTSSSPAERLRASPSAVGDNQGSVFSGAFAPTTTSFGATSPSVSRLPAPVPAPPAAPPAPPRPPPAPPKSEREGLSTISSIILGFCGNDAKKAVQCIEKAYKELIAIANPELKHASPTPPGGLHLARPPDVSTHLSLSAGAGGGARLPLGLGSMMTIGGPDPALLWSSGGSLGGALVGAESAFARSPLAAAGATTSYPPLFHAAADSVGAHLLKSPLFGSPALL